MAIVTVVVVIVALSYMRAEAADSIDGFCGGLDAAAREFHDC